jgi:hypothetical protein
VTGEVPVWSRREAIDHLRDALRSLVDDEHSMCQVASERKIFCRGFRRWPDSEFDRRWRSALGRSTHLSRAQMEELANLWQIAEQIRHRVGFACDAQTLSHGPCRGWDEFSNDELARQCNDVIGVDVIVTD